MTGQYKNKSKREKKHFLGLKESMRDLRPVLLNKSQGDSDDQPLKTAPICVTD